MPDLVAAVTWPLLAASASAAAALLLTIPLSASLAKKSQRQGPPQLRATAAGNTKLTTDSIPAAASDGAASATAPEGSVASQGEARGPSVTRPSPGVSSGGQQGSAQQPDENAQLEPSTLADNHSLGSEADRTSHAHSDTGGGGEPEMSGSTAEEQASPEQQLPGTSPDADPNLRKGFFRDIESDCLMTSRPTQFAFRLKPHNFGHHRVARTRKQWPIRRCMHCTPCLRHDSKCSHISLLR